MNTKHLIIFGVAAAAGYFFVTNLSSLPVLTQAHNLGVHLGRGDGISIAAV